MSEVSGIQRTVGNAGIVHADYAVDKFLHCAVAACLRFRQGRQQFLPTAVDFDAESLAGFDKVCQKVAAQLEVQYAVFGNYRSAVEFVAVTEAHRQGRRHDFRIAVVIDVYKVDVKQRNFLHERQQFTA